MTDQPPARRAMVIFNPSSGWRRRRRFEAALQRLRARGWRLCVHVTTAPGDAERLAATADRACHDLLLVAGGDGTINEVINGLGDRRPPIAIMPLGTANVLAAELGQDAGADAVVRTVAQGVARPVTLGVANGRRFILMAGAGFDAQVVATVNLGIKRRFGKAAYGLAILRQLLVYGFPSYRVVLDGSPRKAASVLVANAHFYGGRFVAAPAAGLQTPTFEVGLFERSGRAAAIGYALALFLGFLPRLKSYRVLAARRIEIEGPPGEPVQADGDVIARLPVRIELLPAAVELVFPPGRDRLKAPATLKSGVLPPEEAEPAAPAAETIRP